MKEKTPADACREREEKRKEATRKMWTEREKRWQQLYGRPTGGTRNE